MEIALPSYFPLYVHYHHSLGALSVACHAFAACHACLFHACALCAVYKYFECKSCVYVMYHAWRVRVVYVQPFFFRRGFCRTCGGEAFIKLHEDQSMTTYIRLQPYE